MSQEDEPDRAGPWGAAPDPGAPPRVDAAPPRERMFNAPWPALAIVAAIVIAYGVQASLARGDAADSWAFAPADLDHGRWWGLLTVMFVHGNWAHALINALGALAFGPPVARLMGPGWKGPSLFFLFYLACGVVATLGYSALHLHSAEPMVGASGAIAGLMGGAARLLGPEALPIAPVLSRPVISLGSGLVVISLLQALFGGPFMDGARIAWEAHLAGFVAGVLLIGPFAHLAGWRRVARL